MAKSDKMYSKSPKIEKDSEGKVGIKKPTEANAEDMGVSGNPLPGSDGKMPIEIHEKTQDMVERHAAEISDLHKRHAKEFKKLHGDKEEDKLAGTPGKAIEKDNK